MIKLLTTKGKGWVYIYEFYSPIPGEITALDVWLVEFWARLTQTFH